MNQPDARERPPSAVPRALPWLGGLLIALAAWVAYADSFRGSFLYDDAGAIERNPTIRHLGSALMPPAGGLPVSGRPVVNFSFALNYAAGGLDPFGYHVVNFLIHVAAGLVLFGIVRRALNAVRPAPVGPTVGRPTVFGLADQRSALQVAFSVALLWTVHPLQTEAVTYLSQRAESLMGLFYLLTIYCFIRSAENEKDQTLTRSATPVGPTAGRPADRSRTRKRLAFGPWALLSVLSCLFGMASKEVMVTAPVAVFLYDRIFVSGGFAAAWKNHRRFYVALAATWLALGFLVAGSAGRGGTAGFGSSVAWWAYAFTQFRAVAHYLRLCLWPHPLAFDYGLVLGGPPIAMAWDILFVSGLVAATVWLLIRGSPWGFLGAWYFLILAPSSSVIPVATEIVAEHRVYLSLAAVMAAVVVAAWAALRRLEAVLGLSPRAAGAAGLLLAVGSALLLGRECHARNRVYRNLESLWSDAVAKAPFSAGARNNLGNVYSERAEAEADPARRDRLLSQAMAQYRESLRLDPEYDDANYNLGNALSKRGEWVEATGHYRAALRYRPDNAAIHYALGNALRQSGRPDDARREYEKALAGETEYPEVWYNLGNTLLDDGQAAAAAAALDKAVRLRPDYADAVANYAGVLAQLGRDREAIARFEDALRLQPNAADVHNNFGGLLAQSGRLAEARAQFEIALRIRPNYREARDNLERVKAMEGAAGP